MQTHGKTAQDILKFIDYLEDKSFVPKNSAFGKKAAISKFIDGLSDEEQSVDYLSENFDTLAHRFRTKNTGVIQGSSLETYQSRTRAAIDDYMKWLQDAAGWERQHVSKKSGVKASTSSKTGAKAKVTPKQKPAADMDDTATTASRLATRKISFPVSESTEVTVEFPISGITKSELTRLGMFLAPYCSDLTPSGRWPAVSSSEDGLN